jgi:pSer/pThr/pTyr-binding forkhead associated (FHA) protein
LRRTTTYLKTPPNQRDNDHDLNTVSRRHLRLTINDAQARIYDLSTNGSFCNGEPMREPVTIDLAQGPCSIRMGTRESIQIALVASTDERLKNAHQVSLQTQNERGDDG